MNQSLESRLARVRFSSLTPGADRIHYVNAEDVRIVLGAFPSKYGIACAQFTSMIGAAEPALSATSTGDYGKLLSVLSLLASA